MALVVAAVQVHGHEATVLTHTFYSGPSRPGPQLQLLVTDVATGEAIPARVSLMVDGKPYTPDWIDVNGIRFTSIHISKRQTFTTIYVRGTGPVAMGLPPDARRIEVTAARGFEYLTAYAAGDVRDGRIVLDLPMKRWTNLRKKGWIAVDEHLHYDRIDPADDKAWLDILAADGLEAGHFMVLKGGMVPGVWARQYAHGPSGQASNGDRLIVPGQEYRDAEQGHINLLGVDEVIEPISTGGMGMPKVPENFPAFYDVLNKARSRHALVGAAHAGIFGKHATAVADAILGALDFWELSNGFIYSTETWYRLMNCGYFLPPAAGTDLPNLPYRDSWQPMIGSVRTYVNTDGRTDFDSFKAGMARGEVFISGGPIIDFTVENKRAGESVSLPAGGGSVTVNATLFSPGMPREFTLVRDGTATAVDIRKMVNESVYEWRFEANVHFERSGWLATQAKGVTIAAQGIDAMAHSGAVRILVGDEPVRSEADIRHLLTGLTKTREHYATRGVYANDANREHAVGLLDRAITELIGRLPKKMPPTSSP